MVTMTRRVSFSAARAYWVQSLSPEENRARLGDRASATPDGAFFALDVTVGGEVDPRTGIIVNVKEIDRIVRESLLQELQGRWINTQTPQFCGQPPTTELLLRYARARLEGHIPGGARLMALRLEETPTSFVSWSAEETDEMEVTRVYEFAASHRLHSQYLSDEENQTLFGKCNYPNGHGHNYVLEVTVAGPVDARSGRLVDPDALDSIVHREVVDRYDHRHFNCDIPEFTGRVPSSEEITKTIWQRLKDHVPPPARLRRVLLRETARNFFETTGEDSSAQ
jgi:6-pyruvoyltetrahydropterin/6-carboxytetrahydropterin synthase